MANIPYIASLSFLLLSASAFRVSPVSDNPDLIIDEELNMVEPKMDFWQMLLRPKAKTTFKNILKFLNNFDSRDKYTIDEEPQPIISQKSLSLTKDFLIVKKENFEDNSFNNGDQFVVREDLNQGLVSDEIGERESLSEERAGGIAAGSVSVESNEKSDNSEASSKNIDMNSSQNSDSTKESSVDQSGEIKPDSKGKNDKLKPLEAVRYDADLPKGLHQLEMDKPRFQHSIRDGWLY